MAFHPSLPRVYAINELDSTAATYDFNPQTGELTALQVLSALPETFVGTSRASEIEVDKTGRFLYVSNRGYDSIALFAIDQQGNALLVGNTACWDLRRPSRQRDAWASSMDHWLDASRYPGALYRLEDWRNP